MNEPDLSRRAFLGRGALALGAASSLTAPSLPSPAPAGGAASFPVSLNTSTLRGQKLPLSQVVEIAGKAGYQGIEPWLDEIERHVQSGRTLEELRRQLDDAGLKVTGAIAFFHWMVDDPGDRARALDDAKRHMERLQRLGALHVAAPPAGDVEHVSLLAAAERYRELLEAAESFGVVPAVEIWGPARNVYRLGQAVLIALEAHHPRACVLPDVFHLYKGGSGLSGVGHLSPRILAGFHLNDYRREPPRERISDRDRVYPGDGVAPLGQLFRDLRDIGYRGAVSIELFNPAYWKEDPLEVARRALEKTRAVMRAALEGG